GGRSYTSTVPNGEDIFVQLDDQSLAPIATGTDATITPRAGTITIGVWDEHPIAGTDAQGSRVWIGTAMVANNTTPNNPGSGSGNPTANLHGWLQPRPTGTSTVTRTASWVDSDMLQVQTRAADSTPTSNSIAVNGNEYTSTLPSGDVGGFQML